jgi:hypothetical protein
MRGELLCLEGIPYSGSRDHDDEGPCEDLPIWRPAVVCCSVRAVDLCQDDFDRDVSQLQQFAALVRFDCLGRQVKEHFRIMIRSHDAL